MQLRAKQFVAVFRFQPTKDVAGPAANLEDLRTAGTAQILPEYTTKNPVAGAEPEIFALQFDEC